MIYSKNNLDALPVSTFAVTRAPCLDPARSADFLSDNNREAEGLVSIEYVTGDKEGEFYPLELDRFDFLRDERQEILLKCT